MIESLPHLVNIPPFMFRRIDYKNLSIFSKILFVIKGKFLAFIIKHGNNKIFCFFINIFYSKHGKINFFKNMFEFQKNNKKFYYPNRRVLRVVNGYQIKFNLILESYCLKSINFEENDWIIDCGANVGEINLALKEKNININYIAFEPDHETYECLKLNNVESKDLYNLGLSNQNMQRNLYVDNDGGNTSFLDFGSNNSKMVESKTLDSFDFKQRIKLFKIDAEGFEPEVLEGSYNTLKNVEFVSVDFGAERGVNQETTIVNVNNILLDTNFSLIEFSKHRLIGLYKNMKF